MEPNSFDINSPLTNSIEKWGLKVIIYDPFSPQKRNRQLQIPKRHGSTEMGRERWYDDRILELDCMLTRKLTKHDYREIVYELSHRNRLFFWDEPDKYYIAELFETVEVDVFPREVMRQFKLPFRCFPFAMGAQRVQALSTGINAVDYRGTAESPTIISIRNPNTFPISHIILSTVRRIMR